MARQPMAGIVLCGGRSARMGRAKDELEIQGERMLARILRVVADAFCDPIVVVAGAATNLSDMEARDGVRFVRDEAPFCGPLVAITRGLEELSPFQGPVFITSCDLPLLRPAFVRRMGELLGDGDAAAVRCSAGIEPLAAVFHTRAAPIARRLSNDPSNGPRHLLSEMETRFVDPRELADIDPDLESIRGFNTPEEWEALRSLIEARLRR